MAASAPATGCHYFSLPTFSAMAMRNTGIRSWLRYLGHAATHLEYSPKK